MSRTGTDANPGSAPGRLGWSGLAILLLLGAGLAFFGLRPRAAEITVDTSPVVQPSDDGSAVITALRDSGGVSIFGLRLADSTHHVEVQFTTEPGCTELLSGDEPWPTPYPECAGPPGLAGSVGGLGVTITGRSLVGVQFDVPRSCFERLTRGMAWPPNIPECVPGS